MEQVKNTTAAEDNVKRYESPEVRVVFVKAQGVLCGSNEQYGNEEYNPWA